MPSTWLDRPWKRRTALALALGAVPLLWKTALLQGPSLVYREGGAPPAMFRFQAKGLVVAGLGYPRGLEGLVSAPAAGSSHAAQLQLMGLWDGRAWTSKALATGRVEGRDLRVRLGSLHLLEVLEVTPARDYNGPQMCQVDYRVRWDLPDEDRELFKVRQLVGLRLPVGLGLQVPGQELTKQVTLERTFLGWRLQDVDQVAAQESGRGGRAWSWLNWLL